ncbi:DNA cytosine methyltransferase [Natrinema saccharevitans]|uniref:DNA cytosine methyltransferase n=1 Tax=Natrinema saccharevitans TaxID=301967 RepID=UPI00158B0752|nr:DNA cytosine methyltransferase [Natrinema saccharevitans]
MGTPTCIDLFAGAGGFSLGFQEAGFDIIAAADKSEAALKTYEHNIDGVTTADVHLDRITPKELAETVEVNPKDVDVVIGGPPCKGFSVAGKMDPDDPRNSLVANYINIVEYFDPDAVVMENVTGILHMEDGEYKRRIIHALRDAGYKIDDQPPTLRAAHYGVPQLRDRVFFFASKEGKIDPPSPTHYGPNDDSSAKSSDLEEYITVEEAIDDLSYLEYGEKSIEYELDANSKYQKEMRNNAEGIPNHKATNHGETVRRRFRRFEPGDEMGDLDKEHQTKKHSMKRWDPNKPAPTVTTLPEDFIHYSQPRIPTVRELARIQSFPDTFEFKGPRTTGGKRRRNTVPQYTQVGNAVPPELAKSVGEAVKSHLKTKRVTT